MRVKVFIAIMGMVLASHAQTRMEVFLNDHWMFSRDGHQWKEVRIPHDWAISGPFDKKWDLQVVAIEQNGEKTASEKSGRSGALPWIGEGEYKTSFVMPKGYAHAELVFDGAMSEPIVFINGHEAGHWAYGYNCFRVDATPYIHRDGSDNEVHVKLQNVEESSRWYPGAGLYRPVKLVFTQNIGIDDWGVFVRTTKIEGETAWVDVDTQLRDYQRTASLAMEVALFDHRGQRVGANHADVEVDGSTHTQMVIRRPRLWSPESPYLYNVVVRLYQGHELIDEYQLKTGIRTIKVSKERGFELNGQTRKIQGVCLHHDLGPLGAAVNKAALIRQVKMMKEMGADAIRTSHNMPSQMQMDICDSLGMMVMAESFDMWIYPKCKNGYARFFKEWSDKDIKQLVRAHRNHPSIIMWSIGNEIPEQWSEEGRQISAHLQQLCHDLDPTRPVTQGMDKAEDALKSGFAQVMDVPGFNYRVFKYPRNIQQLPQGFLLGSETASTVSSRGFYRFPVKEEVALPRKDGQCSSYDTEYCSWSNLPEDDFEAQDDLDYTIGQFVWTGYDYLGEPTPYDSYWPSRSSYFGICDLAGLPKDRYFLYRSVWNKQSHTIHLLPHWTWPDRKGKVTPVYCYTDYPTAELFVNGKSHGKISKNKENKMDRYRLRWNDVVYEPGELKVVVYDETGQEAGEQVIRTAGKADHLLLQSDKQILAADGEDLAFVTVSMVDKEGNLVPDAAHSLTFEVEGQGQYQAACNGDARSLEPFTQPRMKLFNGQLVVLVRSTKQKGEITLRVKEEKQKIEQIIRFSTK